LTFLGGADGQRHQVVNMRGREAAQ
jgi:hypothetical protein